MDKPAPSSNAPDDPNQRIFYQTLIKIALRDVAERAQAKSDQESPKEAEDAA